ncbi:MAG TPA: thiopeptide-type bacteriocin biosynthesis protein [Thermoanaerobaculia bacterium]
MSVQVFYYDAQDDLLLDCIRPLAVSLRGDGLADAVFFIRYYEEGPHIRFRARVAGDAAADEVTARIEAALGEFLTQRPSHGRLTHNVKGPCHADNSFEWRVYEPEIDRYGGPDGIVIAEEHFELSSDVAFDLLARTRGDRQRRLTLALRAMLAGGAAFGLDGDGLARFMKVYCDSALRNTAMSDGGVASALAQFERGYGHLAPELRAIANDLRGGAASDPLGRWGAGMAASARRLRALAGGERMDRFLSSFLHMLNNRLGLPYSTEAYLAFLTAKLLAEMEPANA